MTKVLITGGLGFIGSSIAKKCIELDYDVTIISRNKNKLYNIRSIEDKVNLIIKDIKDITTEVEQQDIIFHCASTVDNYNIQTDPYLDVNVNIIGTISLLEACKKYNPFVKIVYTSTFFVNGNPEYLPVNYKQKEEPLGLYGSTKLCTEHILKTYMRVYDLKIVIARLSNVFGIGEQSDNNKKAAFNRMINLAVNNEPIKLYDNGKITRDYIYVDDVVDALLLLSQKGIIGNVYYVGNGIGKTLKELVDIICKEAKTNNVEIIESPKFHKQVGIDSFVCDIEPLKELGWNSKITVEEGIKRVVEQYRTEAVNRY